MHRALKQRQLFRVLTGLALCARVRYFFLSSFLPTVTMRSRHVRRATGIEAFVTCWCLPRYWSAWWQNRRRADGRLKTASCQVHRDEWNWNPRKSSCQWHNIPDIFFSGIFLCFTVICMFLLCTQYLNNSRMKDKKHSYWQVPPSCNWIGITLVYLSDLSFSPFLPTHTHKTYVWPPCDLCKFFLQQVYRQRLFCGFVVWTV